MLRWFERAETSSGNVVYSRVRLARNWTPTGSPRPFLMKKAGKW